MIVLAPQARARYASPSSVDDRLGELDEYFSHGDRLRAACLAIPPPHPPSDELPTSRLISPPHAAPSCGHGEAHRSPHRDRPRAPEGVRSRPRARVLLGRARLRADAAHGSVGRVSQRRRLPPSHRAEHVGEPSAAAARPRHDRALSLRDPLPRSRVARRRAPPAARRGHSARRGERSRRQRGALPARSGRQRPRALLGSPARRVAAARGWHAEDDDRAARSRRSPRRGRRGPRPPARTRSRRTRS